MWFGVLLVCLYVYWNNHIKSTSSSFTCWTYSVSFPSNCCVMCSQKKKNIKHLSLSEDFPSYSHTSGCQAGTFKFLLACGWSSLHPISSITSAKRPLQSYKYPQKAPAVSLWIGETTDRVRLCCSSLSDMHGLLTTLNCQRKGGKRNTAHYLNHLILEKQREVIESWPAARCRLGVTGLRSPFLSKSNMWLYYRSWIAFNTSWLHLC